MYGTDKEEDGWLKTGFEYNSSCNNTDNFSSSDCVYFRNPSFKALNLSEPTLIISLAGNSGLEGVNYFMCHYQ